MTGSARARVRALRLHSWTFRQASVELEYRRRVFDGGIAAAPANVIGKALGVERVVGEKVEALALHLAATAHLAAIPTHLDMTEQPQAVFLRCG